jgi:hypothetical protein
MITISLNKIRKHSPCEARWKKLLRSKGGTSADMDAQFPLTDVLDSNDLNDTLWCLRCLPEHDKLWRKYAVWCARQVQHLMADQRSIDALDVAWRHADGLVTNEDMSAAVDAAWSAAWDAEWDSAQDEAQEDAAWAAARAVVGDAAWNAQKTKLSEILTAGIWVDSATARGVEE